MTMTDDTTHDLIMAKRVMGASVFDTAGERIGQVDNLSIHKVSGKVAYAILSFGGFLGIGEKMHPLPWSMLQYDAEKLGYVVALNKDQLDKAPSLTPEELETLGAGDRWRNLIYDYYGPFGAVPYF